MSKHTLPERLEDLLPHDARIVERAARAVLDHLGSYGYQQVVPPLAESTGTLLAGDDDGRLGARTLRLTDPLGGEPIGIRADMTAQIRRIDAQHYGNGTTRLCYCGPTIYSRPPKPWKNREQLQAGAELFGAEPVAGTVEILLLALGALRAAGAADLRVVLGHDGIAAALLAAAEPDVAASCRQTLAKRDTASLREIDGIDAGCMDHLASVAAMQGGSGQLASWRESLPRQPGISDAFAQLEQVDAIMRDADETLVLDLATVSDYDYHTGLVFAILCDQTVVARGGSFGTAARPATGFTANLRELPGLVPATSAQRSFATQANFADASWRKQIEQLQQQGWRCLLADSPADASEATAQLVRDGDGWRLDES